MWLRIFDYCVVFLCERLVSLVDGIYWLLLLRQRGQRGSLSHL
jgi:hypothetical protein